MLVGGGKKEGDKERERERESESENLSFSLSQDWTLDICEHFQLVQGFLDIRWAKWKRVLLTRSVAIVPCVVIAILARNSLDYLDNYINVEQSLLVSDSLIW